MSWGTFKITDGGSAYSALFILHPHTDALCSGKEVEMSSAGAGHTPFYVGHLGQRGAPPYSLPAGVSGAPG